MTGATKHRLFVPEVDDRPGPLGVAGEEAHHALRVKRLREGEPVELFDGRGTVRHGLVSGMAGSRAHPELLINPTAPALRVDPPSPRLTVCSPTPKGDRLEQMIDQLSQAGAASWRPLSCEHAADHPLPRRLDRLRRVTVESAKQCGRAHLLEIGDPVSLADALSLPGAVLADASGTDPVPHAGLAYLLVGPEGGWTPAELHLARSAAVPLLRLGPHVLRLETAAVAGAALLMHVSGGTR